MLLSLITPFIPVNFSLYFISLKFALVLNSRRLRYDVWRNLPAGNQIKTKKDEKMSEM